MSFLLDTNIVSAFMKDPYGIVRERIDERRGGEMRTSIIVCAELRYGILKSRSVLLAKRFEIVMAMIEVVPLEEDAIEHYARI